jgi:hypothetical protein
VRRLLPLVLLLAACSGGGVPLDDFCALTDLPAGTPAQLDVLKQQADATLHAHNGKAFANTLRNKRIFDAAVRLQAATSYEVTATPSGSQAELMSLFRSGAPEILPTVARAQQDLRAACS